MCYIRTVTTFISAENMENRQRQIVQATGNLLGHYLFQKKDCAIRRKVDHRVIMSCFGHRNMVFKFFINIQVQKIALLLVFCL